MTMQGEKANATQADNTADLAKTLLPKTGKPRLIVVGAGFGGLNAVKTLTKQLEIEVVVLDRNNYHGFWPLLYQVATAALSPDSIAYPVRQITHPHSNMIFQMARVERIDLENKQVLTDSGAMNYDYLILAAGSSNNYFGNKDLPNNTYSLKDIDQAEEIRTHILEVLEQASVEADATKRKKLLTFAIVGAGPTGVELAGAFGDLLRPLLKKEYKNLSPDEISIVLIEAHDTMLAEFPKSLQKKAQEHVKRMGVMVRANSKVKDVKNGLLSFDDGGTMEAGTVVWAAGVKASVIAESLNLKLAHQGRIPVTSQLNLPDHPEVFVIGDMAYLEGYHNGKEAYPMVAEVAMQMGRLAAHNVVASIRQEPLKSFKYLDLGTMSTIGRRDAVADVFGLQLSGILAWLMWLLVHVSFLISFRNRFLVLLSWAYDYVTFNLGVRLLGGKSKSKIES